MRVVLCAYAAQPVRDEETILVDFGRVCISRGNQIVNLSKQQLRVAAMLLARIGTLVPTDDLVEALYASVDDGGPLLGRHCVKQFAMRARERLATLGIYLVSQQTRGYEVVIDPMPRAPQR